MSGQPHGADVGRDLVQGAGVGEVGIEDNFFDLGGDSILSIQVSSLISEAAGLEVPSAVLFEFPTIRKLAGFLEGRWRATAAQDTPPSQTAATFSDGARVKGWSTA